MYGMIRMLIPYTICFRTGKKMKLPICTVEMKFQIIEFALIIFRVVQLKLGCENNS